MVVLFLLVRSRPSRSDESYSARDRLDRRDDHDVVEDVDERLCALESAECHLTDRRREQHVERERRDEEPSLGRADGDRAAAG